MTAPTGSRADFGEAMEMARKLTSAFGDSEAWQELKDRKTFSESKVRGWYGRLLSRYLVAARHCRVDVDIALTEFANDARLAEESHLLSALRLDSDSGRKDTRPSNPDLVISLPCKSKNEEARLPQPSLTHESAQLIMQVKKLGGRKVDRGVIGQLLWYFTIAHALYRCRYAVYAAPDRIIVFEREGDTIWMPNMQADRSELSPPLNGAHEIDEYVFRNSALYQLFRDPAEITYSPIMGLRRLAALQPMVDLASALENIKSIEGKIRDGIDGTDGVEASEEIAGLPWLALNRRNRAWIPAADSQLRRRHLQAKLSRKKEDQDPNGPDDASGMADRPPSSASTGHNAKRTRIEGRSDDRGGQGQGGGEYLADDSPQDEPAMTATAIHHDTSTIITPRGSPELSSPHATSPQLKGSRMDQQTEERFNLPVHGLSTAEPDEATQKRLTKIRGRYQAEFSPDVSSSAASPSEAGNRPVDDYPGLETWQVDNLAKITVRMR